MDTLKRFEQNNLDFQKALERIIKKYSRVQYEDDAPEVDLNTTDLDSVVRYMESCEKHLNLEGEDVPKPDGGLDYTDVSNDDVSMCSSTFLSDFERTIQPEDGDKELEMTLNSHNSSLADVYSSAVNHIGQAQRFHCVSKAADSVVRKYRKWRCQANGSLNSTVNASFRRKRQEPEAPNTGQGTSFSAFRRPYPEDGGQELAHHSPRKSSQVQQHAPRQERGYSQASPRKAIFVIDPSAFSHLTKTSGIQQNETFAVSGMPPSWHGNASPSRIHSPPAKASPDLSLRSKRLLLAAQQQANTKGSLYAPDFNIDYEKYDVNGSPVRQSLLKARLRSRDIRRSPYAFPKAFSTESPGTCSSLNSTSRLSAQFSPSHRAPDAHRLSQSHLRSKFRRHLSFDSALQTKSSSCFRKNLDDLFTDTYHKYICLNKSSPFASASCQKCAQRSEARRHLSSPALAALVSPHRVLVRKRYRDVDLELESPPQSKRNRGSSFMPSPGSKRHSRDTLRRCLYATESQVSDGNSFQIWNKRCTCCQLSHQPHCVSVMETS